MKLAQFKAYAGSPVQNNVPKFPKSQAPVLINNLRFSQMSPQD